MGSLINLLTKNPLLLQKIVDLLPNVFYNALVVIRYWGAWQVGFNVIADAPPASK
jgi:hypothetical protein